MLGIILQEREQDPNYLPIHEIFRVLIQELFLEHGILPMEFSDAFVEFVRDSGMNCNQFFAIENQKSMHLLHHIGITNNGIHINESLVVDLNEETISLNFHSLEENSPLKSFENVVSIRRWPILPVTFMRDWQRNVAIALIAARRHRSILSVFPREIVGMIARMAFRGIPDPYAGLEEITI